MRSLFHRSRQVCFDLLRDSWTLYWHLLKVIVPVMIAVQIATHLGLIHVIGDSMAPIMRFVGLPGEMSIVWVMAMVVNLYAGAISYIALLPTVPLSTAQATVLGTMMLVAHALPVEQQIIARVGPAFWFTALLRFTMAISIGWILHQIYQGTETLQHPASVVFLPTDSLPEGWWGWGMDSGRSLIGLYVILLVLLVVLKGLDVTGITRRIGVLLTPVLRLLGISPAATSITLSGMLIGITYGGALILRDAQKDNLSPRDIFLASCFLCLCHSILEDTLFMLALGGHLSGTLIVRTIFSVGVIMCLAWVIRRIPDRHFNRWLCKPLAPVSGGKSVIRNP